MIPSVLFLALPLLVCCWGIATFFRNNAVLRYRQDLISRISVASRHDLKRGIYDYEWRWAVFDSVNYSEMVFRFWRPLESFYPDKSFMEPSTTKGVAI